MGVSDSTEAAKSGARPGHALRNRLTIKHSKRSDLWDFIWIVYSVFFFIEPIARRNRAYWIEFAVFYTIFLAIYSGLILDRKSTRLNSSHEWISYAVFCL